VLGARFVYILCSAHVSEFNIVFDCIYWKIGERQNTINCIFDMRSPRITAYNIHEWIYAQMRLKEDDIRMFKIDGPRMRIYIKFL